VIQVSVHPVGEEPEQHVIRVAPRVSCMITIHEVRTKSKLGLSSQDEVVAPSDRPPRPSS
jgi:hypothetical protein